MDAFGYAITNLSSDSEPELEDETDEIDEGDCITLQSTVGPTWRWRWQKNPCLADEELKHNISQPIFMVTFEGDKDKEKLRSVTSTANALEEKKSPWGAVM